MDQYSDVGATISDCGKYRYDLTRSWKLEGAPDGYNSKCVFVMLNPSTADGREDDPTIRRCVGFAKALGHTSLVVLNCMAYRTPHPDILKAAWKRGVDVQGPDNVETFKQHLASADRILVAWGVHAAALGRADELAWASLDHFKQEGVPIQCLGVTKDGHPKHPLYLKADTVPQPFKGHD